MLKCPKCSHNSVIELYKQSTCEYGLHCMNCDYDSETVILYDYVPDDISNDETLYEQVFNDYFNDLRFY